ncbi:hypothetical protein K2Z84_05370 [Candidatus Binatia bacterium]|nr:hypothetical protein [Candidatus Binatia bacterium]
MAAGLKIDAQQVADRFAGVKERLERSRAKALNEAGKYLVGQIVRPMRKGYLQLTGRLKSSIGHEVQGNRLDVGVVRPVAGDVLRYAGIQHEGGTITGKPFLAIPLDYPGNPIFTKAGVSAVKASFVRDNPGQFGLKGTFAAKGVIFGVPANAVGKRRKGLGGFKGWNIIALFALKRSVTIRAKRYVVGPVTENVGRVRDYIARAVKEALGG